MSFILALQFLTSIPVPLKREFTPRELGKSTLYFPVVGLIIGLVLAGLHWLFGLFLPSGLANAFIIVALVLLTGAIHLDGFADTCDGIAGHRTAEERWQVMRDSRIGAFGVIGVVLLLLVKYIALGSIPDYLIMPVLVFMPVAGRWALVYAVFGFKGARPDGLGNTFKQGTRAVHFVVATVITLAIAIALIPVFQVLGLALLFFVWLGTLLLALYYRGKFRGLTGDNYGALTEAAEAFVLLMTLVLVRFGLA
jgi:adenosylcobinamide-GDP ribazoletransferase